MAEYIEREAAIVKTTSPAVIPDDGLAHDIKEAIRAIPAADVRPVVRGEWERAIGKPYIWKHYHPVVCSVCHREGSEKWNGCPYCLADMRKEGE